MDVTLDSIDTLDALAVPTGVLLALVGLATLAGTPWAYESNAVAAVGQIVGAVGAIVVGLALAWFVFTTE